MLAARSCNHQAGGNALGNPHDVEVAAVELRDAADADVLATVCKCGEVEGQFSVQTVPQGRRKNAVDGLHQGIVAVDFYVGAF
ncbi:hypothetical protein SDC9_172806 [bioreactor metagenome]|uniref:Uncharacterized protein n=1 Tax=bioreactor metagenome TaxID=1076179 RepID=A0A645GEP9_9ZZZZ